MISTRITRLLGIEYPVFQGGMAWVSSASLVAAVSNAGGLGILGSGSMTPDILQREIRQIKSRTQKPFGVNLMLLTPQTPQNVEVCLAEKVPVVTTGAGNPAPYVKDFKAAGTKVIPVVSSVALAKRLERMGVDALIAEGSESGGHIGDVTTMALVPQVVDAVSIPVVAAGGIGDGRGILAAFALGAEGVQMGTRFILCDECHAHPNYKQAVAQAKDRDTVTTGMTTGHPVRVLRNKLSKRYLEAELKGATPQDLDVMATGCLRKAVVDGNVEEGSVMAGQISGLLDKCEPCAEIFKKLRTQFFEEFDRIASLMPVVNSARRDNSTVISAENEVTPENRYA